MTRIGIHASPQNRHKEIQMKGLVRQPFWRSQIPVRQPRKFKWKYDPFSYDITGKTKEQIETAVYESLKAANLHITKRGRGRFRLEKIKLYLVDLEQANIKTSKLKAAKIRIGWKKSSAINIGEIDEHTLEAPAHALKQVNLSPEIINDIFKQTSNMHWFEANRKMSKIITELLLKEYLSKKAKTREIGSASR
ncbi:MAG TPA: hypothetical protein VFF13_01815 [archaeon]|nr:hypothetical protein [archaeon]